MVSTKEVITFLAFLACVPGHAGAAEPAKEVEQQASPTSRLLNTLLTTFAAVFLGYIVVRMKLIAPEKGDMKGLGFLIGQLVFPLLIFKTVATAKLGAVNWGTLAACSLGKIVVLSLTWLVTFFGYRSRRPVGQRFLTASVFAFFALASNDFAIGFPVVQALYGGEMDMGIYIAGNSLVGSLIFVPLTMVLFTIGKNLHKKETENGDGATASQGTCKTLLFLIRDILMNPVIAMTFVGLLYKAIFGFTLSEKGMDLVFPEPLESFIKLITSPFGACALFLTGTSLKEPKISMWPIFLVVMKVVVCAYATYFFAGLFVGTNVTGSTSLRNFSFLYGMIPTSSAPLLFANQFDPDASEQVATAILLGLVVAGPMMYGASLFLEAAHVDMASTLANSQFTMNIISLVFGAGFLSVLLALRTGWGWECPAKFTIASYALVLIGYEVVTMLFNPNVTSHYCIQYSEHDRTMMSLAMGWLQNLAQFLVIAIQVMLVGFGAGFFKWKKDIMKGVAVFVTCAVLAVIPAVVTIPSTLLEVCSVATADTRHDHFLANAVWTFILLLVTIGLTAYGLFAGGTKEQETEVAAVAASDLESAVTSEEDDSDAVDGKEETSEDDEGEASTRLPESASGSRRDMDGLACEAESSEKLWRCRMPMTLARGVVAFQAIRFFMRAINTLQVASANQIMGSFAEMLVIESLLEHGQLALLVIALFAGRQFGKYISVALPTALPWLCAARPAGLSPLDLSKRFKKVGPASLASGIVSDGGSGTPPSPDGEPADALLTGMGALFRAEAPRRRTTTPAILPSQANPSDDRN